MDQTLLLLQLSDSAFPTGGFSHSFGLESSVQHQQILTTRDLKYFIISLLENAESHAARSDTEGLTGLDHLCHVCTVNHIANRASTRQGKSLLDVASKVFGCDDIQGLAPSLQHCHYPVVFGAIYGSLGMNLDTTLSAFMSGVIRTAVASAVRLDRTGPVEAQKIVAEVQQLIPEIIDRNKDRSTAGACITFPVPDILQNCHDKLFCKLFYS